MFEKMCAFDYIENKDIDMESHINVDVYERAITSLAEENPDDAWLQNKLAEFKENNY